nr:immunoglobulin light chain junction region [Macaca mulatta]MOY14862.1 immunoglobulin light chain junction region [Macaca mulatta]MOY15058.1 immunoglobulin light chain junction region [Macaca mulatta]MOY15072.1 immunoglobulin light chain junction region [Macaca mulatta]MOY15081.1 immunoglobulin light chain junction region [Macaca mulatta]
DYYCQSSDDRYTDVF